MLLRAIKVAFNDSYYGFLVFNDKKKNYCIYFDTFNLQIYRRIINAII